MAATFKIILAVSGIFVAGAVTGGFVSLRVADHVAAQKRSSEIGARLAEQLRLSPEQKVRVRPIISQTSDELRKIRRAAMGETSALITKMDEALSKELTAEQRVLLQDVRSKEEERRKKWMAERAKRNEARPVEGSGGDGPRPPAPPAAPTP